MGQSYFVGGDKDIKVSFNEQSAQTFRVQFDHTLGPLDLDLRNVHLINIPVVEIFHAGSDHLPYGAPISRNNWMEPPKRSPILRQRIRFQMAPVLLKTLFYYFIKVSNYPPLLAGDLYCYYDEGDATYPRGIRLSSIDGGVTWTRHFNDDLMFAEFGEPYTPPTPPTPPITKWLITNIWYYTSLDGLVIMVSTDVPCHMYMYWTKEPPLKHVEPRLRRGEPFSDTLRYCFVAWHENEQMEPGDTLMHTFIKPNWPICETRWFTFRAKVEDEFSTSTAPIFEKHRTEIEQPLTAGPVVADLNNRTITKGHLLWPDCHDAGSGIVENWHDDPYYYLNTRAAHYALYYVYRSFLTFPPLDIPAGSLITGAVLSIFLQRKVKTYDPNYPDICITQGVQQDPVVPSDYGAQLPYTTIGGSRDIETMVVDQYNDITFNLDGLPWINPSRVTRLCIRQQMDILDLTYPTGSHRIYYYSAQKGDGHQPLLTVSYIPP